MPLDPQHQLLLAYVTLFLIGTLHIVATLLPIAEWVPEAESLPIGAASLALAAFYLVAGVAVARRSRVFLYLSIPAAALEGAAIAIVLFLAGFQPVKLLLLLFLPVPPLFTGFSALDALSIEERIGQLLRPANMVSSRAGASPAPTPGINRRF